MAKVSIIIVSYNGLEETTAPCLQSVFAKTSHPAYEVIVVDNNSSDGTQEYLKSLAEREHRLRLVLNTANRGFAGGNNDGIRAASGDFLVLLNSDTLLTEDWLPMLVSALEEDRSIGLVGPVSNAVGNEQKIYTSGTTVDEILAEGLKWADSVIGGDTGPIHIAWANNVPSIALFGPTPPCTYVTKLNRTVTAPDEQGVPSIRKIEVNTILTLAEELLQ